MTKFNLNEFFRMLNYILYSLLFLSIFYNNISVLIKYLHHIILNFRYLGEQVLFFT